MNSIQWDGFEQQMYDEPLNYDIMRGGLSGQSGDMPPDLHLNKLEQTHMYEREDQLDDYFRSTLKDRTSDAPSFAQDMPRETQNQVRSEVLNIRHSAARTSAEPIHPDLFTGFTERDSRGHHNSGPDFKLYAEQSKARGRFKDFKSDMASDWTVSEGPRSQMRVISDLRKTINPAKERYKIFSTSADSRPVPWAGMTSQHTSTVLSSMQDGTNLTINEAQEVHQRSDNTRLKGDLIKVGYKQTGDHVFSVAQYGIISSKQSKSNIHDSQYKNKVSHKFDNTPSEVKNRLFINMMQEVDRRKHLDDYTGDGEFDESMVVQNTIQKLVADLSVTQNNTEQTADITDLNYLSNNIKKVRVYDPVAHDTVVVDKDIFQKINEAKNIKFARKIDPYAMRNINAEEGKRKLHGDEVSVVVYKNKKPTHITQLPVHMDHQVYDATTEPTYKNNHSNYSIMNYTHTEAEQGVNPHTNSVFNGIKKAAGYIQGVRRSLDIGKDSNPIDDMDSPPTRKMMGRSRTTV